MIQSRRGRGGRRGPGRPRGRSSSSLASGLSAVDSSSAPPGLLNLGRTCSFNVLLQALAATRTFSSLYSQGFWPFEEELRKGNSETRLCGLDAHDTKEAAELECLRRPLNYHVGSILSAMSADSSLDSGANDCKDSSRRGKRRGAAVSSSGEETRRLSASSRVVNPEAFVQEVRRLNSDFRDNQELDVEELWRFFSQRLLTELECLRSCQCRCTSLQHETKTRLSKVLRRALEGELEHCSINCNCCPEVTFAKSPARRSVQDVESFCGVLPLRLPDRSRFLNSRATLRSRVRPITLEECLRLTLEHHCDPARQEAEEEEGPSREKKQSSAACMHACLRCRDTHCKTFVRRLPVLLLLHLARSSGPVVATTGRKGQGARVTSSFKIKAHVDFPVLLHPLLAPYFAPQRARQTSTFATELGAYKLRAVIEHQGRSGDGGHYVCYRRTTDFKDQQPKGKAQTDAWWVANDGSVKRTSWEEVRRAQAYILLYERDVTDVQKQSPQRRKPAANNTKTTLGSTPSSRCPTAKRLANSNSKEKEKETCAHQTSGLKRRRLTVQTAERSLPWGLRPRKFVN